MKDAEFLRGEQVPMTKEEVRLMVLERLNLRQATTLIDVGAGTGSVALEAAIRHPELHVIAIEKNPSALRLIEENRQRFDCQKVKIIAAEAPCPLDIQADAIFIGGSGGNLTDIIDWALTRLTKTGRLVLSFILLDNLNTALTHLKKCAVAELECTQLQISQMTTLGNGFYFKPNNPTFIISCKKEAIHACDF
ncbi:precorrin-6Y C5,15-methyltransferase (decarboxylating), CbiT subunit [Tolumonas auensis DSM 9187]|uniref:Precorrin-6Y C5,15-methyltransferase (Decarboxylating), CbiT subunit n=1 Tax=Tolumonas auensis (strain DSM 9187 / NBRC 110442 / TA 4) TaxID=595494 RepID=C4LFB9_TOLAT|nr:decarboxylating cobalt-precorrin-6B (C(15))-methyltransferase [Tolumonas auensis]ACQ93286.1 precorrin-6Y C5,15-methyltransferase (decarboxylating), CbiT subunit [Tolumonas auensis DSM 9187]